MQTSMRHELKISDQPKILYIMFLLKIYPDSLRESKFENRGISVHPNGILRYFVMTKEAYILVYGA